MAKECEKEAVRRSKKGIRLQLGLRKEEAIKEARHCLAVRECEACEVCSLLCPDLCVTRDEETGEVLIDLDYCKGCGICASVCPKGAIRIVLEEGA